MSEYRKIPRADLSAWLSKGWLLANDKMYMPHGAYAVLIWRVLCE